MTKQDYDELKSKIGAERVEELRHYWNEETNDEETQEWRDEITDVSELRLIEEWDNSYNTGIAKTCRAILEAQRKNKAVQK